MTEFRAFIGRNVNIHKRNMHGSKWILKYIYFLLVINKSGGKKERMKPTGSGRRLSYSTETDEKLLNWVKSLQDSQVNVTREMLQKQALSLIQLECPDFKASSGWVEKFLVRHGITLPGMCRSFSKYLLTYFCPFISFLQPCFCSKF